MQNLKKSIEPITATSRAWLARARRRFLGKKLRAILLSSQQGLFLVDPEDHNVGGCLLNRGGYGEDEIERISSLTNAESGVLFVGSHIGTLAIPVSKRVKRVTAVEANPDTFQLLTWNVLLNRCGNLTPIQMAASDGEGEIEFVVSCVNPGGSKRMPKVKSHIYFYDRPSTIKVQSCRLDDRIAENFDVVVMDIEGSEYFALKGMPRILSNSRHLIVEFLPHHLRNVAGVTVAEFLAPIESHFDLLRVPSQSLAVERSQFLPTLERMFDRDQGDDSLLFSKSQ